MPFELKFFKSMPAVSGKGKKRSVVIPLVMGLLFVVSTAYLIHIPQAKVISDHHLEIGDIVKEDIVIKKDITIEDRERTMKNRQEAIDNIVPIYEYLARNQIKSRDLIMQWFQLIRETAKNYSKSKSKNEELKTLKKHIDEEFGIVYNENEIRVLLTSDFFQKVDIDELLNFVRGLYDTRILTSLTGARRSKANTIKLISKTGTQARILKIDDLLDLSKAREALTRFVRNQKFRTPPQEVTVAVLMEFIDVNVSYSMNLTRDLEQRVSSAVNPVLIKLKAGKVILRKGDEVTPEDHRLLKLIAVEDETREQKFSDILLIVLVLGFLTIFANKFLKFWASGSINQSKLLLVMGATITVSAIIYRISLFLAPLILRNLSTDISIHYEAFTIFFAVPFSFGVLTIAFVFNLQNAVLFSFINSIIGAMVCNWDFRIFLYILLGNLVVSYGIEYYQRLKRSPIIKAAIFWLLPVNTVMIATLHLTLSNFDWMLLSVNLLMGLVSAILAPLLANFLIPLWELVFDLVTELKLVELTNLNLPIFREMLEKAPGTYHHSLMVASLSEAAAQDLGISPLLQRAMALYHDIGKIDSPHFFTENHTIYQNPHPKLAPRDSAKNIISHIPEGLERAEKLKIPPVVASAITQHHGSKLVRYFYDKAREMSAVDSDGLEEKVFKYPGTKPTNIENAIIMLADQVEAASKSLSSPTEEEIKNVITKIVDANVGENQFDECEGLTFKALNIIANSFHKKLSSIYHMRVSYPGFNFKGSDSAKENGKSTKTVKPSGNTDRFKTISDKKKE